MPKWVDRARKASNRNQAVERFLRETIEESRTVHERIQFIMELSGGRLAQEIGYDDGSMNEVEQFYRSAAKQPSSIEFGIDNFERLLSLYLGQSFVERKAGEWVQYEGKYQVAFPIVIRLSDGEYVDVFLFCTSLYEKQVVGWQNGQALTSFIDRARKMSFP